MQGVGGGGLVPATLAIVAQLWPADRRGVPLGVVGAVQELGSVLGPVLGALVLVVADWRAIFWLNALLGRPAGRRRRGDRWRPRRRGRGRSSWRSVWSPRWPGSLALAAPEALTTSVSLGVPFVPIGDATSRLATPIGVVAAVFLLAALAVGGRGAWPLLRRADLLGAALLGGALGCVVLTFAASEPATEVVGPLGYALLPVAALLAGCMPCTTAAPPHRWCPAAWCAGGWSGRSWSRCSSGWRSSRSSSTCRCSRASCTRRARPRRPWCWSASSLAVPVGALAGGWALRRLGNGVVAAAGLALAAVGLAVMATWGGARSTTSSSTAVLALTGLGIGLALAPVNDAALARGRARRPRHGIRAGRRGADGRHGRGGRAAHRHRAAPVLRGRVATLPDPTDTDALKAAAVLQVAWVFRGAAVAAGLGALASLALGLRRRTGEHATTFGL